MPTFAENCLGGKRILITGELGAIGGVVVEPLLLVSATVAVNDVLEDEKADELICKIGWAGDPRLYFKAGVTNPDEARALVERAVASMGRLEVALCHAGRVKAGPIPDCSNADREIQQRVLDRGCGGCNTALFPELDIRLQVLHHGCKLPSPE